MENRLREASPNSVYKNPSFIDVGGLNGFRYRDLLYFEVTEKNIEKAVLSLCWYYPDEKTREEDTIIEVYRPASSWNPEYVSWNFRDDGEAWANPGGDWYDKDGVLQGSTPYDSVMIKAVSLPDNSYYTFDVTELVKEDNTGILIKSRTESNNYIAFYGSSVDGMEPKLEITVYNKPEPEKYIFIPCSDNEAVGLVEEIKEIIGDREVNILSKI